MDLTVRHAAFPSHPGAGHARHIDGYAWLALIAICDFACTAAVLMLCSACWSRCCPCGSRSFSWASTSRDESRSGVRFLVHYGSWTGVNRGQALRAYRVDKHKSLPSFP